MADNKKELTARNEFGTVQQCWNCTQTMQTVEDQRALDRAKINNLFNGKIPYTPAEEEKANIIINVNWGYGKNIARDANAQLNRSTNHRGILFSCSAQEGRVDKRDEWSQKFTTLIHKPIKEGQSGLMHYYLLKQRNSTLALHGIGAMLWPNDFKWMPRFVALEDLLIPTETYCDFSNLRYFAVNYYLTPGELSSMTKGDNVLPGWNKPMLQKILKSQVGNYSEGTPSTWRDQPEAMNQIYKENNGWYTSDIVPKIKLRGFYYTRVDQPGKWYRNIMLREAYGDAIVGEEFLFDGSKASFSDNISQILSVQYGDNNFVAPLKYHAVRGIGVDLFAPVETLNRLQCELVQHTFEQLKMYFRIQDPQDRDRLKQVVLSAYGVIPEGLNIVPAAERHQIDAGLVNQSMALIRQNMQETSSAYVSDPDNGTEKEMTAKEATIKLNQANAMVSGMMDSVLMQEAFYYQEIVRRFCNPTSTDSQVKEFRAACIQAGIPEELLKPSVWKVSPERVLGNGDKTQAQFEAEYLMGMRPLLNPTSQQKVDRLAISTVLNDPAKAENLVPFAPTQATAGRMAAEDVFATLMTGQPCVNREGIEQSDYVSAMIEMTATVAMRIQQTDNMGTPAEILGLNTVAQNISQHIEIMNSDPANKQKVKLSADALSNLTNEIKGFQQRQQEAQQAAQAQSAQNPEVQAKLQAISQQAEVKMEVSHATASQKLDQKEQAFSQKQAHQQAQFEAKMAQEEARFHAEMVKMIEDTKAQLIAAGLKTGQEIAHRHVESKQDLEIKKKQAKSTKVNKPT